MEQFKLDTCLEGWSLSNAVRGGYFAPPCFGTPQDVGFFLAVKAIRNKPYNVSCEKRINMVRLARNSYAFLTNFVGTTLEDFAKI